MHILAVVPDLFVWSVCLSVRSVCLYVCLSGLCLSVWSASASVCLSGLVCLSVCVVCLSVWCGLVWPGLVCLSVYLSVCVCGLSVCLCVCLQPLQQKGGGAVKFFSRSGGGCSHMFAGGRGGGLQSDFFMGAGAAVRCLQGGGVPGKFFLHSSLCLQATADLWPRVALRSDLAGAPATEFEQAPKAELHPTMKLYGSQEAVVTEALWERLASALVTVDSVGDSVMGQGNTRWFKTPTRRCKGKSQEGAQIQFLEVHLPVNVMYRDCDGPKTWVFTVYGGPASGKYEHVLYENGVATRKGAHWLQAVTRIGGGDVPGTAVRYMESKIMEYVAKQRRGMLGGCTHIKVEDDDDEEEEPEPKKFKADPPKRKSKASTKAAALRESDSEALVETLADAVRQAAKDACKEAVQAALKPKGADAKVHVWRVTTKQ